MSWWRTNRAQINRLWPSTKENNHTIRVTEGSSVKTT
jgi:hypothetical protein